jgi:leader peptidase (prepilin peptidase)/N-methyltransferase
MIIGFAVFIFGAMVGSFLNVCIARIPKDESIVKPRSHCPQCKALITAFDNIPLLSYLLLRGRCRGCGVGISLRYPLVELLMGALAAALYWQFGLSLAFVVGLVFSAALLVISCIDLDVRIVPDVISLPGIVVGLLFHCSLLLSCRVLHPWFLHPGVLSLAFWLAAGFYWQPLGSMRNSLVSKEWVGATSSCWP